MVTTYSKGRCQLCDCTNIDGTERYFPEKYKPYLSFRLTSDNLLICNECDDEVNEVISDFMLEDSVDEGEMR